MYAFFVVVGGKVRGLAVLVLPEPAGIQYWALLACSKIPANGGGSQTSEFESLPSEDNSTNARNMQSEQLGDAQPLNLIQP